MKRAHQQRCINAHKASYTLTISLLNYLPGVNAEHVQLVQCTMHTKLFDNFCFNALLSVDLMLHSIAWCYVINVQ